MSYRLAVLSDLPLVFWALDETTGTTLVDASGQGYNGVQDSTNPAKLNQIGLAGGMKGVSFSGLQRFTANVPGFFLAGTEPHAFSLECWVKASSPPKESRGLIVRDANNGLYLTPGGVELRATSYNAKTCIAYYTVTDWSRPLHIVANYVGRNLGIIVNGEEGSNVDFFGEFEPIDSLLSIGGTGVTSSVEIRMTAPAIYKAPLNIRTATTHYDHGVSAMRPIDVAVAHGGRYYPLDDTSAEVSFHYLEDTRKDFEEGVTENLIITDDYLMALGEDGVHTSDLQYLGDCKNVVGSRVSWESSDPVIVETSLDMGATWTACTNNTTVPGIGPNADLSNKFLMVRKRFVGVSTLTYAPLLDKVSIVVYSSISQSLAGESGMAVYGALILASVAESPARGADNMGATFVPSSYAHLPSPSGGTRALSFWYRRNSVHNGSTPEYIFDNRVNGGIGAAIYYNSTGSITTTGTSNIYINGASKTPVSSDFPVGEWVHLLVVFSTSSSGNLFLNSSSAHVEHGRASFAHPTLFTRHKNARDAFVLYNMYRGLVNRRARDSMPVRVAESRNGLAAYSYAWSSTRNGIS